jgi:hypothetical protein
MEQWSGMAVSTLRHAAFPDHDRQMKKLEGNELGRGGRALR